MDATAVSGRWTRVRTLGRGASGAVVSLAADDRSGALFAVKSARAADDQLRREGAILSALCSPHVLPCLGFRASDAGECQLFLEFAPGGTLADVAERQGGRLEECLIRAYAADVARGLAYLHGRSVVHGDIKSRNVVVGADGRAKIADFGCARSVGSGRPVAGTPAFMAPEVARGEEQGPAADVWALGCTVLEMATGRAPWSDMADVLAALHRIGYTDAVPEVPAWLSAEAKHFLSMCFARDPRDRCTAAQLLEHPFLSSAGCGEKPEEAAAGKWVSPKSTLDAELWELSDTEEDEEDVSESPAERIKALACTTSSAFPDWNSDEGWIDVLNEIPESIDAGEDDCATAEECLETEVDFLDAYVEDADRVPTVGSTAARLAEQQKELSTNLQPPATSRASSARGISGRPRRLLVHGRSREISGRPCRLLVLVRAAALSGRPRRLIFVGLSAGSPPRGSRRRGSHGRAAPSTELHRAAAGPRRVPCRRTISTA
ncbi:hypothetical protein QYE76_054766 [Lolium multiflorum]|uniref:Protein kinase domain-containing protein n=1 Tax=Lolium multiflorum TaxID=4521 RepID=A0AAD8WL64_LOLMU|nr:hypothetical protein QYE76_054766 [Lolium multiflorum]